MSQYHNIMWMWYCDIWLKLLEQKGNILVKVLYFYVILWYFDILTKELWPNITISRWMWYCDILLKLLEQKGNILGKSTLFLCYIVTLRYSDKRIMTQYHNNTLNVILWYSIKMVLVESHNITISRGFDIVISYQNDSSRILQYHMGCDSIRIIFNEYHNITTLWYCDILVKPFWLNITISHPVWYWYICS